MKKIIWLFGAFLSVTSLSFAQTTAEEWVEAGRQFVYSNLNDKAFSAFNKALELEPTNFAALVGRGSYHYWSGNDEKKALADAETASKIGSKNVEDLNSLGNLFGSLSLNEKSLEWYEKAIMIDSQAESPLENKARTLEDIGRQRSNDKAWLQRSLAAYVQLTEAIPNTRIGWLRRGYVEVDLGLYEKAVSSFTRNLALQKEPGNEDYRWRGHSYLMLKKYEEAIIDLSKAGSSSEVYGEMAQAYEGKKDDTNALKYWNWSVSSPYSGAAPLKGRAAFYRRNGKIDLALADEKKAAEIEVAQKGE